jgi:hypothetical protein
VRNWASKAAGYPHVSAFAFVELGVLSGEEGKGNSDLSCFISFQFSTYPFQLVHLLALLILVSAVFSSIHLSVFGCCETITAHKKSVM